MAIDLFLASTDLGEVFTLLQLLLGSNYWLEVLRLSQYIKLRYRENVAAVTRLVTANQNLHQEARLQSPCSQPLCSTASCVPVT